MYRRAGGPIYSEARVVGVRAGEIRGFVWGYSPEVDKVRYPVMPTMSLRMMGLLGWVAGWSTA